ncbi:hypothetical protein ACOME3_007017 [Neoechinorhynchus agilis]
MKLYDALLVFPRSCLRGFNKRDYIHGLGSMYPSNHYKALGKKRDANNEDDMEGRDCDSPDEFAFDVPNVLPLIYHRDEEKIEEISPRHLVMDSYRDFTKHNVDLQQLDYGMGWKFDDKRFLVLIKNQNEFAIHNLLFVSSTSSSEHLSGTLVDAEMVTDIVN